MTKKTELGFVVRNDDLDIELATGGIELTLKYIEACLKVLLEDGEKGGEITVSLRRSDEIYR